MSTPTTDHHGERIARLEAISEQLGEVLREIRQDIREGRRDFRWIVGIQVTGFLVVIGTVISLFVALSKGG